MEGGYATVKGLKMYYEVRGKGRPLVLLHGGAGVIGSRTLLAAEDAPSGPGRGDHEDH